MPNAADPLIVEVHIELRSIFVAEAVYFQLHYYMAFQNAVVEYKVSEIVVPVYQNAFLTGFKAEAVSHFKQAATALPAAAPTQPMLPCSSRTICAHILL